jgi:gamma-glutamylcyclotransferase (GGCT)/AIG2-like uncharacterized protein YtfP
MQNKRCGSQQVTTYNLRTGKKKYYFTYRMYIPHSPYPAITIDINSIDGNLANITLEVGVGIRLK